jgi:hypothetical protein
MCSFPTCRRTRHDPSSKRRCDKENRALRNVCCLSYCNLMSLSKTGSNNQKEDNGSDIRHLLDDGGRSTYETSVNFYRTARRNVRGNGHRHIRRRKDLKSQQLRSAGRIFLPVQPSVIWQCPLSTFQSLCRHQSVSTAVITKLRASRSQ